MPRDPPSYSRRESSSSSHSHRQPGPASGIPYNSSDDTYVSRVYQSYTPYARRSFNYWRDDSLTWRDPPRSYQSYRPDASRYDDRRRDDSRSSYADSSYSRRRRDSGSRSRDEWNLRERSPTRSSQYTPRNHYSTYTPTPYLVSPTFRAPSPPREPMATSERQRSSHPSHSQRKPSPSPPPPNKSSIDTPSPTPSPAYLTLTGSPSMVLQDPTSVRKLLVLDLNGTLLIRSQHSGTRPRGSLGHKLRAVQPRPYMRSFREYLFSHKTKEWLDTMVWSSAQPHSVEDMVDKVFGSCKVELKAVWNRKSLGLSEEDYHRKSLTTKDLTKPWKLLPLGLSPGEYDEGSLPSSQSQIMHSASTTLLLDDSPHKAILQPYNHVCIPEYDSERRHRDLWSLQATKEPKEGKRKKKGKSFDGIEEGSGARARDGPSETTIPEREHFDATLLAVIGVLEAVKLQSNVAGWIRKGGLWPGVAWSVEGPSNAEQPGIDEAPGGETDQSAVVVQTGNDEMSTSDPAVGSGEAHLQTAMWFSDSTTMAHWVARGREALKELGIEESHGVTG